LVDVEALDPGQDALTQFVVLELAVALIEGCVFGGKPRPVETYLGSNSNCLTTSKCLFLK
jgi:hypothetical protein